MNASTSSPPSSPATLTTTETTSASKRNFTFWRPVLACGGALLTGAVLVHLFPASTPAPPAPSTTSTVVATMPIMLASSQIIPVRLVSQKGDGRMMHGQWQLSTDATGRATTSGEVARWVVEPGAHVRAGDSVVEISSGGASRPVPIAESRQNRAEQEQVSAANGQTALSQKLSIAQTQLAAAQDRVTNAQAKVASARALVGRLIAGEKIPVDGQANKPTRHRPVSDSPAATRLNRESKRAQDAVAEAQNRVSDAKTELDDAKKAFSKAQKKADVTTLALTKVEGDFKAEKTTADVLQNARADADDAQSALKAAQTRMDVAQHTYSTRQDKANTTETVATETRAAAQKAPTAQTQEPTAVAVDGKKYVTADQAVTLVSAAQRESKDAARQADRVRARVDDYQRQVKQTSQQVETATKDLQTAQQSVLDSAPRPTFTTTRAPADGTITWISRLAREVGVGQTVFGISQGKSGFLRFEDQNDAWKSLRVGQTLNAAAAPEATPDKAAVSTNSSSSNSSVSPSMPGSPTMPSSSSASTAPPPSLVQLSPPPTFSIRITRISPPSKEGEAAQIDAVRTDGSPSLSGTTSDVQAELPAGILPVSTSETAHPAGSQTLVVPLSVVLPRDGSSYVAVVGPSTQGSQPMTLSWRSVKIERETAFDVEIKSGLHAGERVVDQPILLLSQLKPEEKKSMPVIIEALD